MPRAAKFQRGLSMLEVAAKIGEDGPSKAAIRRKMIRLLRDLEKRAGRTYVFREGRAFFITPSGLASLLKHRRAEDEERADEIAQVNAELASLRRGLNALAASGRSLAHEVETLKRKCAAS